MRTDVSIVVPVFNEAGNLIPLHREICAAVEGTGRAFEVIFVDDGSIDESLEEASCLAWEDGRVRVVRLGRNYGQSAAIQAGCEAARGRVVVTIDGDLQNDPADIPRLLAALAVEFDVVCGWRTRRQGHLLTRRLPSRIANWLIRIVTGMRIHDHGCTLKAFKRDVMLRQPLYSDLHRFSVVLMGLSGASYHEIEVKDRPRVCGQSKYGLGRVLSVLLDLLGLVMIQRYWAHPGRWFMLGGLPFAVLALAFGIGIGYEYAMTAASDTYPVVWLGGATLSVFASLHFFFLATVSELIVGVADRRPNEDVAAVRIR